MTGVTKGIFSAVCTRELFGELVRKRPFGSGSESAFSDFMKAVMTPAVMEVVRHLAKEGRLRPVENVGGHKIGFVELWSAVSQGDFDCPYLGKDALLARSCEPMDHNWAFSAIYRTEDALAAGSDIETVIDECYADLVECVARGNTDRLYNHGPEAYCSVDDITYKVFFHGWNPTLFRYDVAQRKLIEVEPIDKQVLHVASMELTSGDLLIADWFRIEGFNEQFEKIERLQPSIGSEAGRALRTAEFAKHGVIHVEVGNTSPGVFREGEELIVGRQGIDSEEGASPIGRAYTDLWWVTVIERERLVEIIAANTGCSTEEAEERVAEYLVENDYVVRVRMPPGKVTVHFAGDTEEFAREFHCDDLEIPSNVEPFFVVSSRDLEPVLKPDRPTTPSP